MSVSRSFFTMSRCEKRCPRCEVEGLSRILGETTTFTAYCTRSLGHREGHLCPLCKNEF